MASSPKRHLARAYAAFYAAQLLLSWSAYGAQFPTRPAAPRKTALTVRAASNSSLESSSNLLQACKPKRRRVRASWERRLAVVQEDSAPVFTRPARGPAAARPSPLSPDPAPPDHPPA